MADVAALVAVLGVSIAPLFLVLTNSAALLFAVLFGGLLVFQSSGALDGPKIAYLAILVVAVAVSIGEPLTPLTRRSLGVGAVMASLTVLAVVDGNDPLLVVRDASNYLFLVAAGLLAVSFGRRVSERAIWHMGIGMGALAVYAFTAQWIGNRGLGSLPTPGVPSVVLFGAAVSGASVKAVTSSHTVRWWAVVGVFLTLGLVTGTRSMLLMLTVPLTVAAWAVARPAAAAVRMRARRSAVAALIVIPVFGAATVLVASSLSIDVTAAFDRVATIVELDVAGNSLSLEDRRLQHEVAVEAWQANSVVGAGPGTVWEWQRSYTTSPTRSFTLDTSMTLPAKWGLVGTVAMLVLAVAWAVELRPNRSESDFWSLTALGLVPLLVGYSLVASVLEDRGLPLVLVILGAGKLAWRRTRVGEPAPSAVPSAPGAR